MSAGTIFYSLYKYKSWSEAALFNALLNSPRTSEEKNINEALWHLAHINIVDNLFISRLQGIPMPCTTTTTEELQDIADLCEKFSQANEWLVNYTKTVTDDELEEKVKFVFADSKLGNMRKSEILAHVLSHGLQHRGMISTLVPFAVAEGWQDHYTTYLKK